MKTIVLVGTTHRYQTQGCKPEDAQAFQRFLLQKCRQYGIKTVAEELNEEALEMTKNGLETTKQKWENKNPEGRLLEDLKWINKALERWEGKSIAQKVAAELFLKEPLFCEPDSKQRELLGIEDSTSLDLACFFDHITPDEAERRKNESWTKRELSWLGCLREVPESEWPVLFICGARHVESFSKLLDENGFDVRCIREDWEP